MAGVTTYRLRQRVVVLHVDAQVQAATVEPVIPVNLAERTDVLLTVLLVLEEVEQVGAPLFGRNALPGEGLDVVLHVWQEVLKTADCALQMQQEVGSLTVS